MQIRRGITRDNSNIPVLAVRIAAARRRHYPTVPVSEMETWDIAAISEENCLLFMWTSSPHLDQAIRLGKAWGFKWATVAFVWDKQRVNSRILYDEPV